MEHVLELANGNSIPLYFGTWSLMRFCEQNGNLSYNQMQEVFAKDVSYKEIIQLLLCGAEHWCRKNKKPFDYTDIDAGDWIDELGGLASKKSEVLLNVIGQSASPSYQGVEVLKGEEKKSQLVGTTSESNVLEPV